MWRVQGANHCHERKYQRNAAVHGIQSIYSRRGASSHQLNPFMMLVDSKTTEEKGEASNIVADFDGVILSDETYLGSKNKSRGDTVRKGEVLISGVVEGVDMKPLYYQAKGKFTALHKRSLEYSLNNKAEYYCFSDGKKQNTLLVFGLNMPLFSILNSDENKSGYSYENYLEFDGYEIPFGIKKTVAVNHSKCRISERESELLCILNFTQAEYKEFSDTNILLRQIKMINDNGELIVSAEYNCIDFIGESKPIFIENNEIS